MSRYPELTAKVDAFFERAASRHGADMQCGSGCSDCCHARLSITSVEAEAIRHTIAAWSEEDRAALRAHAAAAAPDRCAALGSDGRCAIYEARPIVCRSHGAPIRLREGSLPVVRACFRNFPAGPQLADPDCIIDQTTLSALVLAVDRDAGGDGSRIDLAALLESC
jgi:Fe-S-cluster containining protein